MGHAPLHPRKRMEDHRSRQRRAIWRSAREMVKINLDNMAIIGTVNDLPGPTVVSNRLANVTDWTVQHYNYARTYPFRADQWYFKQ